MNWHEAICHFIPLCVIILFFFHCRNTRVFTYNPYPGSLRVFCTILFKIPNFLNSKTLTASGFLDKEIILLLCPFYKYWDWGSEKWCNFLIIITPLETGSTRIESQFCLAPDTSCLNIEPYPPLLGKHTVITITKEAQTEYYREFEEEKRTSYWEFSQSSSDGGRVHV